MTNDDLMGDEVYQPTGHDEQQDDVGPLEAEDTLVDRGLADVLDEGYASPERPLAVERYGITAAEQHDGEPLERRLAAELPEVSTPDGDGLGDTYGTDAELLDPEVGELRTGRLVECDDARSHMIAADSGICGGAATAEEAAMHTVDDPEAVLGGW